MRKQILYKEIKYITTVLLFALPFASCTTLSPVSTDNWRDYFRPGRSKEEIAKDFNLYKGKWWNYYARGRWFAEEGYYDEAARDFKKSINLRSKDQRLARSYGLHFWEYFAHRELGIVYYQQKKYEDAKAELETSLSTEDSARAKFYLNKCNEAILKLTGRDQKPPEIKITSHTDGMVVNTPLVKLKGFATDDFYIGDMHVHGKRLFVELAEKRLYFQEDILLHTGRNTISLEALDLLGKSIRQEFNLILDIHPPILYLDDIQMTKRDGKHTATIQGIIEDDHAAKRLYINNTEIPIIPGKEVHFKQDIIVTSLDKISLKVIDAAGNETKGEEQIGKKASLLWPEDILNKRQYANRANTPLMVASGKMDRYIARSLLASHEAVAALSPCTSSSSYTSKDMEKEGKGSTPAQGVASDNIPPVVHTDLKPAIVHDANLFFSMDAHDDSGVAKLFVNQYPLEIRPGKHIFFNYLLPLTMGENVVTVRAIDIQGNEAQLSPVKITKRTFELLETDARYTVAWLPLRAFEEREVSPEILYSMLLKAFDEEPKRFNFVERDQAKLAEILREQKISNTQLASPDTAVKIGKIHAAEGIFFGAVEEDLRGVTITLQLVDTETTKVLAHVDVYDEDKSMKNLAWLVHGLSLKMKRQFPLIEGNVIRVSGNGFHIDAGGTSGLKLGMKLLLFREVKEGDFVLKEPLDAIARIVLVQPDTSFAKISTKGAKKVKKRDFVITK
ncbi:MAG: hypothetical protein JETT_1419 [Candidatus Jettenia ecosi]|uniref:Uncharacterized protein n=1 Tax=Candidatus Jettenia ecosi TaxID=2494326 RepID=A0A533QC50_9BACT|nr:MAG: hypothetical protein JETT_1419 [Candidatus Jettenia ecosi]